MSRNTLQKQIVMQALKSMHDHPTASQIYAYIHQDYPTISKATVFRILNQACEDGTIMKVMTSDNEAHYEMLNKPHYHMRCRLCSKLIDAPIGYLPELNLSAFDCSDFLIEGHTIEFYGLCADCQAKLKKEN
ncbi:MAG: transcriptional repressor [Erysipelotrichaceae bacterium]|nr:transcriptional repressor [Erysipelotrichaceae bacterium]MDY5252960.1 transcriptional repressor [Erysipelotrichaceae bacterium]